jgi:DNA-binding NarL/FixJ family response regulator
MALDFVGQLNGVTSSLYAAVFDDGGWSHAVASLRQMLHSDLAAIGFIDHRSGRTQVLLHGDCGPKFERLYNEMVEVNPFMPFLRGLPPGGVVVDEQLVDPGTFENTAFFSQWMRPQAQHSGLVIKVAERDGIDGYFMASRGGHSSKYRVEEIKALSALSSALTHAVSLHVRLSARMLEQTGQVLDGRGIGWMAVEPSGRIIWRNGKAEALLERSDAALKSPGGRLVLTQPHQTQQLQAAIRAASTDDGLLRRGTDMIATQVETGHAVALSIIPADNLFVQGLPALRGAYIGMKDLSERLPPGFEERIRSMFDLTPKEAMLATALASGQGLGEAAAQRHIAMATARSQLAQLFRKTGTSQQSQLVSVLLAIASMPPNG